MTPDSTLNPEDRALLVRYYAGLCSRREQIEAEELLGRHPRAKLFANVFARVITHGGPKIHERELDSAIAKWHEHTAGDETIRVSPLRTLDWNVSEPLTSNVDIGQRVNVTPSTRPMRRAGFGIAQKLTSKTFQFAMFSVAISMLLMLIVMSVKGGHRGGIASTMTTYRTHNSERADITLPDGSTVTLNVGSTLQVPADFAAGNRTLRLTGEALFTVTHHQGIPFTVLAGTRSVRVLGTTFLVRQYNTDTTTVVAVRQGKVAVGSTIVSAQHQVQVFRGGHVRSDKLDPTQFSFATGVLDLNGVQLQDAIGDLNRWYDVDIRLSDPALGTNRLQLSCVTSSVADLVELLSGILNVRVERSGRILTLYPTMAHAH